MKTPEQIDPKEQEEILSLTNEVLKSKSSININGVDITHLLHRTHQIVSLYRNPTIPNRLTDEQIDAMFPYDNKSSLHRRIIFNDKQDWKRKGAKQVRDLLQGKGGEGV